MKKMLAAIGFFTRIPVWRIADIPAGYYRRVVDLWPAAGWVTSGFTALALWLFLMLFPVPVAVVCAFAARLVLTGALHEDGLADFIDGFGGGRDRARILEIMKDSHTGSYGVTGLIVYFLLLVGSVSTLPVSVAPLVILAGDPWSKFCASFTVNALPYARNEQQAKNKLVYERMSVPSFLGALVFGSLPAALILFLPASPLAGIALWHKVALLGFPLLAAALIIAYLRYKIGGYTGDCCGAAALLCELSFYLTISAN